MMRVLLQIAFVLLALLNLAAQSPPAKEQRKPEKPKTEEPAVTDDSRTPISLGVELVTVGFSAVDERNRYVPDLKPSDVRVYEDGKPQKIFSFSLTSDLPLKIVLLLDVSGSERYTLHRETAAARRFFASVMRPGKDRAAIMAFHHDIELVEGLTDDRSRIERALDELERRVPVAGPGADVGSEVGAKTGGTALNAAIFAAADHMLSLERGRKMIIVLTDGFDSEGSIKQTTATERTLQAEAIIYALGIGDGFRASGVNTQTLTEICRETGGRAYFPRRPADLDEAFLEIERDLRQQYVLTYSPNLSGETSSFRTIRIEIPSRPGLKVSHRRGYFPRSLQK